MIRSWPLYAKITAIFFLVYMILYGLYIGQDIITPLGFAFLFSILLRPVEKKLIKWRCPRVLAIIITLLIAITVFILIITFLSTQIKSFVKDIPEVKRNLNQLWDQVQQWLSNSFNFTEKQQQKMIDKASDSNMGIQPMSTLGVITGSLASIVLIPVYIFLFLYYRPLLVSFITDLFDKKHISNVQEVLSEIRLVMQSYITGLMLETSIVAALNVTGLLLIGAPFAFLLGIIAAILNLIPYIGGLVAMVLTALITYTNTGSMTKLLWAIIIFLVVQLIDNNFLVPKVIASKVKLNALISIIGVLIGGALCGLPGMFLSIPFIAICKVIFDRVDELQPWGKLLGDDMPVTNLRHVFKRKK
ncbi:MAG: AI-2E family transporter [Ferruginibacter sp.]